MTERQHVAYKLVELPDGGRGLATLNIPKTATVFETDYKVAFRGKSADSAAPSLMRTDDILTVSIVPVGGKASAGVMEGRSIRSHNKLSYKVGQHTKSTLNTSEGKGDGICFFWDPKTPLLWDKMFA